MCSQLSRMITRSRPSRYSATASRSLDPGWGSEAQAGRYGVENLVRVADGGELTQPDAVRARRGQPTAHRECEGGFPDPSDTGERHEAALAHRLDDVRQEHVASKRGCRCVRQVRSGNVDRSQRLEFVSQSVAGDLVDLDCRRYASQLVVAQGPGGGRSECECCDCAGAEHLATMSCAHQARAQIHRGPKVVPAAFDGLAGVNSHPHPQLALRWPTTGAETLLRGYCGGDGVPGGIERCTKAVPASGEDDPAMGGDRITHDLVVCLERVGHNGGSLLP